MGTIERVAIRLGDRHYDILIGSGLLSDEASFGGVSTRAMRAVIVTNPLVGGLYEPTLRSTLSAHFSRVLTIELPDGESHKSWISLNTVFDTMLREACDRKTVLFALGGGVIGDLTGFAAACYMRGVPFVQVPTTLLAQVDSSVGGKTAINHPLGKNMIGAFYQPQRVIADIDVLDSLPPREISAGLAEVIKYGPIADLAFLDWIDGHIDALRSLDKPALAYAIKRSCEIKAWVVEQDERESDVRAILNFGHTFGHAIEAGLGYGEWLHGEAVGCGMVLAADLSQRLGLVDEVYVSRLRGLIARAGLPIVAPALGADRYLELMRIDKKAEHGEVRFVVVGSDGRALVRPVPDELVRSVLQANCR